MSYFFVLFIIVFLLMIFGKLLNLNHLPSLPRLFYCDEKFSNKMINLCPMLTKRYIPTTIWGFSGHIQTIIHALIGRLHTQNRKSTRRQVLLPDGATLTWDEWSPLLQHTSAEDCTIVVCPGICNSSESVYVWSFAHLACCHGFSCIVLNHLGALHSVKLTSPRIFSYGRTEELHVMLSSHVKRYPQTRLILVGFSMGGNIVTRYMSQPRESRVPGIVGAISICQGYDPMVMIKTVQDSRLHSIYMMMVSESMKHMILRHRNLLFSSECCQRYGISERKLLMASSMLELDDVYTRNVEGYASLTDLYNNIGCVHKLHEIEGLMVFLNSRDDPLVKDDCLNIIRSHAVSSQNTLYIETTHGGHLGFYQGGVLLPDPITWLDRLIIQLADAFVQIDTS